MADFKVVKSEFNDALNTAAKAKESFSMAVVRTAAVNKKFQFSALGLWAATEAATAGALETDLRTMEAALDTLVTNLDDAGTEIEGTLTSSRDDIFSAVCASAAVPGTLRFTDGESAKTATTTAKTSNESVKTTADSIKDDCGKLENSGAIVAALDALSSECTTVDSKLSDLETALTTHRSNVDTFDGEYAGKLDAAKFITDAMVTKAQEATRANIGEGNFAQTSKNILKVGKNYLTLAGEIFKGEKLFDWAKKGGKGWRETFLKKLSEGTWGISSLGKRIKQFKNGEIDSIEMVFGQIHSNITDIKNMKGFGKRAVNDLKVIKSLKKTAAPNNIHMQCSEIIRTSKEVPHTKFGSGLKSIGRTVGYVGDVIDVIDTVGNAGKAFSETQGNFWNKAGAAAGQVVKGAAKIGVGKVIGAAVGACFGGPVGAVVGMAVGTALGTVADAAIDGFFGLFGVKSY